MTLNQIATLVSEVVTGVGFARAKALSQYEVNYAVNTGAMERYRQLGVSYVEWLCAMDEHSCPICEGYATDHDGIYKMEDAPICPAHPGCRCALTSVLYGD